MKYITTTKNLFNQEFYFATRTAYGVTLTNNGDGSFTLNGTATETHDWNTNPAFDLVGEVGAKYTLSHKIISGSSSGAANTWMFFISEGTTTYWIMNQTSIASYTKTLTSGTMNSARLIIYAGMTYKNLRIAFQLEKGTSATSYVPYGYIPIHKMRYITNAYNNVDLGTLTWRYSGGTFYAAGVILDVQNVGYSQVANAFCSRYETTSRDVLTNANNRISIHKSDTVYISINDTNYTDATTFKNSLSGVVLTYELLTPKTQAPYGYLPLNKTRYMNNLFGNVDLGTLTWTKYSSAGTWLFYADIVGGRTNVGIGGSIKIMLSKYNASGEALNSYSATQQQSPFVCWDATNSQLLVKDTNYTDATTFKNSLSGVILTYELATPKTTTPYGYIQIK